MQSGEVEILIVEDEPTDIQLILRALKKGNLTNKVHVVRDGVKALDFLYGTGTHAGRDASAVPKVVLLDLKLPKLGGIEVLKKLKGDPRTQKIPVVIMTSSREEPDMQACYALGANSYVVKPVAFEDFAAAVAGIGYYWMLLNEPMV
jgi:two-component system response regulator